MYTYIRLEQSRKLSVNVLVGNIARSAEDKINKMNNIKYNK